MRVEDESQPGEQLAKMSSFLKDNGLFPAGSKLSQSILLQLYRLLASGQPVEVELLARSLGLETSAVRSVLKQLPPSNIVWDEVGRITAYRGLDINITRHRIIVNGKTLFAWCAFDCLFLPELLENEAEIFSICPDTGSEINFRLDRYGNTDPAPANLFISFIMPDVRNYEDDLRQTFCCHVNFFATKKAGVAWTSRNSGTTLINLDEAIELAKIRNKAGFSKALL